MRLTELHEEWAWNTHLAKKDRQEGLSHLEIAHQLRANGFDAEIRARVAAQEIGRYEAYCPACKEFLFRTDDLYEANRERIFVCGSPGCGQITIGLPLLKDFGIGLIGDIPDAERVYPTKRRGDYSTNGTDALLLGGSPVYPISHWVNHQRHVLPFASCHLCQHPPHAEELRRSIAFQEAGEE